MHSFFSFAGGLLDMFSMYVFKLVCSLLCISDINSHLNAGADFRISYLFTDTLANIYKHSNAILLLSINMRKEAPVMNIRISSGMADRACSIGYIGSAYHNKYIHLGVSSYSLYNVLHGSTSFSTIITNHDNNVACVTGRTFNTTTHAWQRGIVTKLFNSINSACVLVSNTHIYEICAFSCYNVRNLYS
jgi:hypothetical protein